MALAFNNAAHDYVKYVYYPYQAVSSSYTAVAVIVAPSQYQINRSVDN
jgi:hypothetical protein